MAVGWTEEQKKVIKQRNSDLLVSAAAGSGKTAVLVERIMQMVMDPEHPMDIDQLLVVTFTRAAAGEMKERIGAKFASLVEEDPENDHLQRQGVLLHNAQITTIDGFCTYVIQNYFQRIGIDPGYRIAEEGELSLLRGQVIDDLLEEEYSLAEPEFLRFADAYAPGRSDGELGELILDVYSYAMSDPDPEVWLAGCVSVYEARTKEEIQKTPWFSDMMHEAKMILGEQAAALNRLLEKGCEKFGPEAMKVLSSDAEKLEEACDFTGYEDAFERLRNLKFGTLRRSREIDAEDALWNEIREGRDEIKANVQDVIKRSFDTDLTAVLEEFAILLPYVKELVRLVTRFRESFAEAKRKKNIADFNDLEHFALEILLDEDENGRRTVRTDAAKELAQNFREVMIDEYQDSNFLQERILKAVSGDADGRYNRFMVGDMKQSIYGFRMARPELFLQKFNTYSEDTAADHVRIDLSRNFRSRREVLDSSNALFRKLMIPEIGGIRYDDKACLYLGASYPPPADASFPQTELLVIDRESEEFAAFRSPEERMRLEAGAAAARIRELMKNNTVRDGDGVRPLKYSDIVVLLRSANRWGSVWVKALQEAGIPAYAMSKEGYFSTLEIATVLNYLRLIDNPRQDIPLAAVLRSPMVGCTDEELARIRTGGGQRPDGSLPLLYESVCRAAEHEKKLRDFLLLLDKFRRKAPGTEVHDLIREVLEETGYGRWAAAMPAGEQREANLKMLIEKAVAYEKSSYHGLFHFIQYIDRLKKYSVDYGEVNLNGEADDIVRIMTIHQSKGLQFPVVFVSGLGSAFNKGDFTKTALLHATLGIGLKVVDLEHRIRYSSVYRRVMQRQMQKEMYGEELRVLYVALTRAEEKLILTGQAAKGDEISAAMAKQDNYERKRENGEDAAVEKMLAYPAEFTKILGAKSYLSWVLSAMPEKKDMKIHLVRAGELAGGAAAEKLQRTAVLGNIGELARIPEEDGIFDPKVHAHMKEVNAFSYPYAAYAKLPAKATVTEIKKRSQMEKTSEELPAEKLFAGEEEEAVPAFARESGQEMTGGAARGTVYHHFFECFDYSRMPDADDGAGLLAYVEAERSRMMNCALMSAADDRCIRAEDFVRFLQTPLGRRMKAAADAGCLRREQPFVIDVPAKDIDRSWPEDENILVQGTIDAYFSEGGGYVLVDYKTDRIRRRDADGRPDGCELAEKYHKQLEYYADALKQITGREVREMYIYSVQLGREIKL